MYKPLESSNWLQWRTREEDVVSWLKSHKVAECFNIYDVDQLFVDCKIFNDRIGVLMSLIDPLSKLSLSSQSQKSLLDLLVEIFEVDRGYCFRHHQAVQKLYKHVISHLNEETFEHASSTYHKLLLHYRKTHLDKDQLKDILVLFEGRFPVLRKDREDLIKEIVRKAIDTRLVDYLKERKAAIDEFKQNFPNTYQFFIYPLEHNSVYHSIPLYVFYCNPIFFGWFCSHLSAYDKSDRAKEFIEKLEVFLQNLPEVLDEGNHRIFLRKIEEIVKSTEKGSLHEISNKSLGLYAEMLYLIKHIPNHLVTDFPIEKIEIPANEFQKNCDFRLIGKEKLCKIVEIKAKMPGHGVDGTLGLLNDFLINYSSTLVNLLHHVCPDIDILGLFPHLIFHEPSDYEVPMGISKFVFRQRVIDRNLSRKDNKREQEQELISDTLHSLYDVHLPIPPAQRIAGDQERLEKKMSLAESLYEKDFIEVTISKVLEKFRAEKIRAQQTLHIVDSYAFFWLLSIPSSLTLDPYAEDNIPMLTLRENIHRRLIEDCFKKVRSTALPDLEKERIELIFLG